MNEIICGDCLEVMSSMESGSVDLVITSPPYNLGGNHHTGNKRYAVYSDSCDEESYQSTQIAVINECLRLLSPVGSIFYNHKNRISKGRTITPYEWLLKTDAVIKQEMVWYNGGQNFDKCRFYPMTERVYWLSQNIETQFRNNVNKHDLWNYLPVGAKGQHKRAFPCEMVEGILACFPDNIVVLDPYMGSGTTAIACIRSGRRYIGIELEQKYVDVANERVANELSQPKLFDL